MTGSEDSTDVADISLEVSRECLVTRTRQLSRVLTALYNEQLRPFGLNSPQFSLLVLICRLGPISRAELGRENHQERSTLTRNLALILAQGWAREVTDDDRGRPIVLTGAGQELLRRAAPAWRRAQAEATRLLGDSGASAVRTIAAELPRRTT